MEQLHHKTHRVLLVWCIRSCHNVNHQCIACPLHKLHRESGLGDTLLQYKHEIHHIEEPYHNTHLASEVVHKLFRNKYFRPDILEHFRKEMTSVISACTFSSTFSETRCSSDSSTHHYHTQPEDRDLALRICFDDCIRAHFHISSIPVSNVSLFQASCSIFLDGTSGPPGMGTHPSSTHGRLEAFCIIHVCIRSQVLSMGPFHHTRASFFVASANFAIAT